MLERGATRSNLQVASGAGEQVPGPSCRLPCRRCPRLPLSDRFSSALEWRQRYLADRPARRGPRPCCRTRSCSSVHTCARRRCVPPRSRARSRRSRICCSSRWTRRLACLSMISSRSPTTLSSSRATRLARLRQGFPLSDRLIREIHGKLLSSGRGSGGDPGRDPAFAELDWGGSGPATPPSFRRRIRPSPIA